MPASTWRRTTPATPWRSLAWKVASSALPASCSALAAMRSSGLGRLPAWLGRSRSLLFFMSTSLEFARLALLGEGACSFLEILAEIKPLGRAHEHDLAAQPVHVVA